MRFSTCQNKCAFRTILLFHCGFRCDDIRILNGHTLTDTDRLNMYGYIAIFCAEKPFFTSKPNPAVVTILRDHDLKEGCKGCVLTVNRGLFSGKFIREAALDFGLSKADTPLASTSPILPFAERWCIMCWIQA